MLSRLVARAPTPEWTAFVGAVVVRLTYWTLVTPTWVPNADAHHYVQLSRSLAGGHGFQLVFPQLQPHPTAFRPPLYPVLLSPGAWLFGDALWPARLLNVLLGALVVVLVGVVAARIGGPTAGRGAAAVAAIHPGLLANDTVTLTEPLGLALLLGAILLADDRRWALAGGAAGLLLLTRPNGYLVVLVLAAWAWRRAGARGAFAVAMTAVVVIAPWSVRNQVQLGTWRLTTSDGFTLAAIYGPPAQAEGHFVDPVYSPAYDDVGHRLAQFDEATWSRMLTDEAVTAVRANPRYVGHTVEANLGAYFELDPSMNVGAERNDGRNLAFGDAVRPLLQLLTVLGLVGLVRHRRDPRVRVLGVVVAQFMFLSLLLVAPPRLRAPLDSATAIGAGLLLAAIVAPVVRRKSWKTGLHPPSELLGCSVPRKGGGPHQRQFSWDFGGGWPLARLAGSRWRIPARHPAAR